MARDAQGGDTSAKDTLAVAFTGMTYAELSDEQKEIFDTVLDDVADGKIMPDLQVVDQGDVNATTEDSRLPEEVSGAYIPGKDGKPGTILIARDTLESGNMDDAVSEEMGEAIAEYARVLGLEVHEGDAGARLRLAASGDDVAGAADLFETSETDTASVRFEGEVVEAEALFGIPGTGLFLTHRCLMACPVFRFLIQPIPAIFWLLIRMGSQREHPCMQNPSQNPPRQPTHQLNRLQLSLRMVGWGPRFSARALRKMKHKLTRSKIIFSNLMVRLMAFQKMAC
ncbi:MAG: hypothetical protein ABJ251_08070 [Paracoccaceae bacterium]